MPHPDPSAAEEFVPFATAALDLHRTLAVPDGPLVADAAELDALHAHAVSLLRLMDLHAERARPLLELAAPLRAARLRAWQLTDLLHHAAHTAPHATAVGTHPPRSPGPALCRRHQEALRLIRRRTTPADLRT